ncbi:hypothetical protein CA982_09310 [Gordonia lacunae]|uniref:Uncharacterized protein n=1 Tax=Gordonia lacunae TaxID=417102 RepID=A0A243QEL0_9ACTN|nr:hypothetical protein CA982_09310 [Gordonia lacunae]
MYVDCARCPARPVACDGCMMTVLFGGPSWDDMTDQGGVSVTAATVEADAEIDLAIDVLQAAAMVTSSAARSARSAKTAAHGSDRRASVTVLRAG